MSGNRLISISMPVVGLTAEDVLRLCRGQARVYWHGAQDGEAVVGFGSAADLRAWGRNRFVDIERQVKQLFRGAHLEVDPGARPRVFGGFAFRDDFLPDHTWSVFHPAQFVLPHFQFCSQATGSSWLTMNVVVGSEDDGDALIPSLRSALEARYAWLVEKHRTTGPEDERSPAAVSTTLHPLMSQSAWTSMIDGARAEIRANHMTKVVLARAVSMRADHALDGERAIQKLNQRYYDSYRFLFEPQVGHMFVCATPERLIWRNDRVIRTMALAATTKRGATDSEDNALAAALMASTKDRLEHDIVARSLRERLTPLCRSLEIPETPGILRLANLQHLITPMHGTLGRLVSVIKLVAVLHPTPALGGQPLLAAMNFIRDFESVPRGWYGAPFGWVDAAMNGEFVVAIRSAVAHDREAWLYAGVGIVEASDADKEWEETTWKFRPMLEALGA